MDADREIERVEEMSHAEVLASGVSRHPDAEVRLAVVMRLGAGVDQLGLGPRFAETLVRLARDEDDQVREWACFALGQMETVESVGVVPVLTQRLSDPAEMVRSEALRALAYLVGGETVVRVLEVELGRLTRGKPSGFWVQRVVEAAAAVAAPRLHWLLVELQRQVTSGTAAAVFDEVPDRANYRDLLALAVQRSTWRAAELAVRQEKAVAQRLADVKVLHPNVYVAVTGVYPYSRIQAFVASGGPSRRLFDLMLWQPPEPPDPTWLAVESWWLGVESEFRRSAGRQAASPRDTGDDTD